jgi:hypothetical protein
MPICKVNLARPQSHLNHTSPCKGSRDERGVLRREKRKSSEVTMRSRRRERCEDAGTSARPETRCSLVADGKEAERGEVSLTRAHEWGVQEQYSDYFKAHRRA